MLTFNVVQGYQGQLFRDFFYDLWFFYPTDRPNIKKRIR